MAAVRGIQRRSGRLHARRRLVTTPPDHDAAVGIALTVIMFVIAVTSGAWIIASVAGVILAAVVLALA